MGGAIVHRERSLMISMIALFIVVLQRMFDKNSIVDYNCELVKAFVYKYL